MLLGHDTGPTPPAAWRGRKSVGYVPHDAQIAKDLRREFIRRQGLAACVALDLAKPALKAQGILLYRRGSAEKA
jgi:hypothetical protein